VISREGVRSAIFTIVVVGALIGVEAWSRRPLDVTGRWTAQDAIATMTLTQRDHGRLEGIGTWELEDGGPAVPFVATGSRHGRNFALKFDWQGYGWSIFEGTAEMDGSVYLSGVLYHNGEEWETSFDRVAEENRLRPRPMKRARGDTAWINQLEARARERRRRTLGDP
jgi:hypothetical protein